MTDVTDDRGYQTRVYRFRAMADFPEPALRELRRAHELSNLMIELEQGHAVRVAAAWREFPDLEQLEKDIEVATEIIEDAADALKKAKQRDRSTKPDPELKAKLLAARKVRKACKDRFREAKDLAYPVLKPKLVELNDLLRAELKATYKPATENGLYWANYNAVRDRHNDAVKAVRSARRMGKPSDLRFRRWTGEGTLTVQLQRQATHPPRLPTTIADAEKGQWRNVVSLTPAHDPDEWATLTRAQQRRIRMGTLRFRIGSQGAPVDPELLEQEVARKVAELGEHTAKELDALRAATKAELGNDCTGWVELPVIVHRPIPLDADICMMEITRRRLGSRFLVHVSVVVRLPEVPARTEGDAVALHVGWRALEDRSIRVGVITGASNPPEELASVVRHHGEWAEIVIPARWRDQMEYVQSVASIRGRNLDGLKKWILEWLDAHPDHSLAGIETIDRWRSPNRFAGLSLRIRDDDSIDIAFRRQLEAWRKQDRHLWDLEANLRDKILHRRNDAFAKVAAWALENAALLQIDTFRLTALMRKPDMATEDPEAHRRARANRVLAAPGMLRAAMIDASSGRGVRVQSIDGAIASVHHVCGTELDLGEREAQLMVWCSHCQKVVDQDVNTLEMIRKHA